MIKCDANDRLLSEAADDWTPGEEDRFTVYGYGLGNAGTQQTSKTVYDGLDDTGAVLETTTNAYNLQGRLQTVADGSTTSEYTYNDSGIRVGQAVTTGGTTTTTLYVVDDNNPTGYSQVLEEKTSTGAPTAATTPTRTYTLGHDVLAQVDGPSGEVRVLLKDGHGSTRQVVDETGDVLSGQVFAYRAYGEALGYDTATAETTIQYAGQWFETTVGMQYLRARWYDPTTGTFKTLDPYAGNNQDPQSLHKYLYTEGDPVNGIDPTGKFFTAVGAIGVQSVSGFVRQLRIGPALGVLDKVQTFSDAAKVMGQFLATGTVNPALLAGLLASITPFGKLLGGAKILSNKVGNVIAGSLDEAAEALTDGYAALRRSGRKGNQLVKAVGDLGAIGTARNLGLEAVEDFPTRYHGIDGLFRQGDTLVIVEAKGGAGHLATGQMSQNWIKRQIEVLRDRGYTRWADQLRAARDSEKIQGLVVNTPVDGAVVGNPTFTMKAWTDIGESTF